MRQSHYPNANIIHHRQHAGLLLQAVLEEEISAGVALTRWPNSTEPDPTLDAAYQALWHFEADEERQRTEVFYLDAQLELLRQIARYLLQNKPLPEYLMRPYTPEHRVAYYLEKPFWVALWHEPWLGLQRKWEWFRNLFRQALKIAGYNNL